MQILEQADQDVRITVIGVLKEIKEKMNEMDKRWRNIKKNWHLLKKTQTNGSSKMAPYNSGWIQQKTGLMNMKKSQQVIFN